MLVDEGRLAREGDAWVVAGDLSGLRIPPTVSALLSSRLDRLPEGERVGPGGGVGRGAVVLRRRARGAPARGVARRAPGAAPLARAQGPRRPGAPLRPRPRRLPLPAPPHPRRRVRRDPQDRPAPGSTSPSPTGSRPPRATRSPSTARSWGTTSPRRTGTGRSSACPTTRTCGCAPRGRSAEAGARAYDELGDARTAVRLLEVAVDLAPATAEAALWDERLWNIGFVVLQRPADSRPRDINREVYGDEVADAVAARDARLRREFADPSTIDRAVDRLDDLRALELYRAHGARHLEPRRPPQAHPRSLPRGRPRGGGGVGAGGAPLRRGAGLA